MALHLQYRQGCTLIKYGENSFWVESENHIDLIKFMVKLVITSIPTKFLHSLINMSPKKLSRKNLTGIWDLNEDHSSKRANLQEVMTSYHMTWSQYPGADWVAALNDASEWKLWEHVNFDGKIHQLIFCTEKKKDETWEWKCISECFWNSVPSILAGSIVWRSITQKACASHFTV